MKIFAQTTYQELQLLYGFSEKKYQELVEARSILDVSDGSILVVLDDISIEQLQSINIFKPSIN